MITPTCPCCDLLARHLADVLRLVGRPDLLVPRLTPVDRTDSGAFAFGSTSVQHVRREVHHLSRSAVVDRQLRQPPAIAERRRERLLPTRPAAGGTGLRDIADQRHRPQRATPRDRPPRHRRQLLRLVDDHVPVRPAPIGPGPFGERSDRHPPRTARRTPPRRGCPSQSGLPPRPHRRSRSNPSRSERPKSLVHKRSRVPAPPSAGEHPARRHRAVRPLRRAAVRRRDSSRRRTGAGVRGRVR